MNKSDKYKDLLPAYIAGKITQEEKTELEAALAEDPQLRKELAELKEMSDGLTLLDVISEGHIDSELLARYAVQSDGINKEERTTIEKHFAACSECREEFTICSKYPEAKAAHQSEHKPNIMIAFLKWLVFGQARLKPVYAMLVVLVMAIPLGYMMLQQPVGMTMASYEIIPTGARTLQTKNEITLDETTEILRLDFVIPVLPDKIYNIELLSADSQPIISWLNQLPKKAFTVDIPASYLPDTTYTLVVNEMEGGIVQEVFTFPLNVTFTEK